MNDTVRELLKKERYNTDDLRLIMKLLRAEDGCPWDREQTHESIRKNLIEETYEVVEAIDNGDRALMREELGDVLLQVVFHAEICEEDGEFTYDDVTDEICRKLIVRHPHIFSDTEVNGVGDVLTNWDAIKNQTKNRKSTKEELDGISHALPSLMRAQKICSKLRKAGRAVDTGTEKSCSDKAEIGRALLALCAQADALGIDAEEALSEECERIISAE